MKREFFNTQFAALMAVYTYAQKMPDVGQEVYWEMLKDMPDKIFEAGVRKCLAECKFFPTIAELGEACLPTKRKLGCYNPYGESIIELNWRRQLEDMKQQPQISANKKALIQKI